MSVWRKKGVIDHFRHPTDETINRLIAAGAQVWRTDQVGPVSVISDGSSYSIEGYAYPVFLPVVVKPVAATSTTTPPANLGITALSGFSNPKYVDIGESRQVGNIVRFHARSIGLRVLLF